MGGNKGTRAFGIIFSTKYAPYVIALLLFVGILVAVILMSPFMFSPKNRDVLSAADRGIVPGTDDEAVIKCINYCKSSLSAGPYRHNVCLVVNVDGYGCAVSLDGQSACPSKNSLPQILLDSKCELIRVS